MSAPFYRELHHVDAFAGSVLQACLEHGDPDAAKRVMAAIDAGPVSLVAARATDLQPAVWILRSSNYVIIMCGGTKTGVQGVFDVLGSIQSAVPPIPGKVSTYFGHVGKLAYLNVVGAAQNAGGRKVVVVGHSLGGATAQVVSALLRRSGVDCRTWVYGCPRVGDPEFASAFPDGTLWRLENAGDPIVVVPPPLWAGVASDFPRQGIGQLALYVHGGRSETVYADGTRKAGSFGTGTFTAARAIANGDYEPHYIDTYMIRLRQGVEPEVFDVGGLDYSKLSELPAVMDVLLAQWSGEFPDLQQGLEGPFRLPGDSGMARIRCNFVFDSFNGRSAGWTETYFTEQPDIATAKGKMLPTLVDARRALLHRDMGIAEVRFSKDQAFRDSDLITSQLNSNRGQINDTKHADVGFTAFNLRIQAGTLYRGRIFLRGIPDDEVINDAHSPPTLSKGFVAALNAFQGALLAVPCALLVQNKEGTKQGEIAGVSVDNAGVITITTKANHGLVTGDQVNIIGSGHRPANGRDFLTRINDTQFRLSQKRGVALFTNQSKGYFWFYEQVLRPITSIQVVDVTSRRPGRPFDLHPGKRRTRRATA